LIFCARAPGLFFLNRPSYQLLLSTALGILASGLLATYAFEESITWQTVGIIVMYDAISIFAVDLVKMFYKYSFEHRTDGIIDDEDDPIGESFVRKSHLGDVFSAASYGDGLEAGDASAPASRSLMSGRASAGFLSNLSDFTVSGKLPESLRSDRSRSNLGRLAKSNLSHLTGTGEHYN